MQPRNISLMSVTREVSRPERSRVSAASRLQKRSPESAGARTPPSTLTDLTACRRSSGSASRTRAISPDTPSVGRMVSLPVHVSSS